MVFSCRVFASILAQEPGLPLSHLNQEFMMALDSSDEHYKHTFRPYLMMMNSKL